MKLKKLEVTGFKSFMEKTRIEFTHGISAIVGPNGCGKSNVIDAIRWAMGEQSVKQLRGKSMEDIIFAGSDGKPPMNMAEVSLTLLNDNGSAPEELRDFSEIQVTRRLFRSGESAYFLNKRPCRLKDIHNIFLGSGMGSRSYAIIQQGNIGAITDANPEERRVFIEEAAGVSRYKARKKEALQKVDATNQNLFRLNDIVSEVYRQMGGLNRQAKKAERYRQIQEKVQKLDVLVNLRKHKDFTREIEGIGELLKSLKDADLAHGTELRKLDAAVEEIKLERDRLDNEISRQKSTRFETQRRIDALENDLAYLRRQVEQREKEIVALRSARSELEFKNRQIVEEVRQSESETVGLGEEIAKTKDELFLEQNDLREMKDQTAPLTDRLEQYKKELMELVGQEARINNICQTTERNRESVERRLKRIDEEAAEAEKKVSGLVLAERKIEQELAEHRESMASLNSSIRSLREELDIKARSLGQQVKTVQSLELNRKEIRSKFLALKKMDENFDWYKDGVKAVLKDAASRGGGEESGVFGIVADILSPEAGYETAVEAVLGEGLQYVVVRDQQVGESSIEFLTARNIGRSGFVPLSALKIRCAEGGKPDSSRLLLNRVTVKQGCEKAAETLLGHVVVASDLREALRIWNDNGVAQTVVTVDGQVISEQGVMAGGSKEKLSGILEKKREIHELEARLARKEEEVASARDIQEQIEAEVRDLETGLQRQIEEKNHTGQMEIDAEKSLFKATEELKGARRHLEIVRLEQDQLAGEQTDMDDEMRKYERERARIAEAVKAAQENVARTSVQIEELSSELESRKDKVVDVQLRLTSLSARYENNVGNLRRLKEFLADGEKRFGQTGEDIVAKTEKQKKDGRNIEERESALVLLYEAFRGMDKELEDAESDCQAIDARLKQNDREKSELENKRSEILEKMRTVEMQLSQRRMQKDNLASRLEERYSQKFWQLEAKYGQMLEDAEIGIEEMEGALQRNRERLGKLGDVNMGAIKEYENLKKRYDFLIEQRDDLQSAIQDLHKVIRKINRITQEKFMATFDAINEKIALVFPKLFEGGGAQLVLTEPENPLESGVELMIHPPGKKLTRLSLLSGGEKALSAIAFIFSIFLIKPASFCLLDEIDAPLDEGNVYRFNNLLRMIGESSQIIMITHNKRSMEFSDTLFGVTMEKKGISKLVSVNLNGGEGNGEIYERQANSPGRN